MFPSFTPPHSKPFAGRVGWLAAALLVGLHLLWTGTDVRAEDPDYGDDFTGAQGLSLGTPISDGELTAGDVDVFTFTVSTGDSKDVWLYTSGETDTSGQLFDDSSTSIATATPIAENDDSVAAGTANFLIAVSLEAGTYFVAVSGAEETTAGTYALHSLDLSTAAALTLGTATSGTSISAAAEIDVFKFTTVTDPQGLWLYTTGPTNTVGLLFDEDGVVSTPATFAAASGGSIVEDNENFLIRTSLSPATYYIAVRGGESDTTGDYVLQSVKLDDSTAVPTWTLGTPPTGTSIDAAGEFDLFTLSLTEGGRDVWLYSTGSTHTAGFLFDQAGISASATGPLLTSNDSDLATDKNFYLGANPEAGTYYVAISGGANEDGALATGAYALASKTGTDQAGEIPEESSDPQPTSISAGTQVEGIIWATGTPPDLTEDVDLFKLDLSTATEDTDAVIYTTGEGDTVGTVFDPDGDEVDSNDDTPYSDGDFNFVIARSLEPDVYYIEVKGYGARPGPYKLHVGSVTDQSDSLGTTAEDITPDSKQLTMGFIGGKDDTDYFKFTPGSAGIFRVYTVGGTDTVGDLKNSGGTSQGENDDGRLSPGHRGFMIERSLSAAVHYVAVTGYEDETGPYRLVVEEVKDPGDTNATAGELKLGEAQIGAIGPGGDKDLFKLEVEEETEVVLYTSGRTDTKAELLDSTGASLSPTVEDDDSGEGFNFLIHAILDEGTHYIRVEGFTATTTGSYALFAEPVAPVAAFPGFDGEHAVGRIRTGHDQSLHKFALASDTAAWIYTTGSPDTHGTLYDSEFNEIASNDDIGLVGLTGQFSIRETLDAGTYYVRVSSYGTDTGRYALHVYPVDEPGSSRGSAITLELGVPEPGTIDSANDADYFRFQFNQNTHNYGSETYFLMDAIAAGEASVEGEIQSSGGSRIEVNKYPYPGGFILAENFRSGTYYVKVTAPSGPTPYTVTLIPHARYAILASDCAAETADLPDVAPSTNRKLYQDPYYACQWHLKNRERLQFDQDINIEAAWATMVDGKPVNGEGVNVVVVDDGMDWRHEDLRPNVQASRNHDYGGGNDIYHTDEHHGTAVSGVLAARDNSIGVRGVAPRATIHGHNFLAAQSAFSEADSMVRNGDVTAVSNNSWGPVDVLGFAESFWESAVEKGVRDGYGGKGTFYVFAAGNGALDGDDANLDEFANFYAITSACGVNDRGTRTNFSVKGSSLWVCAPAGDTRDGYRGLVTTDNSNRYRDGTHGTSFSAPIVSGVAALLRQVEPDLTWRDLKLILAASARKTDPDNDGWEDGALEYGSATDRYHFNHEYGFGVVDAKAAVDAAQNWELAAPLAKATGTFSGSAVSIADTATQVTSSVNLTTGMSFIEFVEVRASFHHTSFRDLDVELVSPAGKVSKLVTHHKSDDPVSLTGEIRLGSSKHPGENPDAGTPQGRWTLRMTDEVANGKVGTLESWEITVYGHSPTPDSPRAVSVAPGPERLTVTWQEPEVTRGTITGYDIRYTPLDGGEAVEASQPIPIIAPLSKEITGLPEDTEYTVEVRARNATGDGPWSAPVKATTEARDPDVTCGTGAVSVGFRTNTVLVADCDALLSIRATLQGSGSLNWSTGLAFSNWEGVTRGIPSGGTPERLTSLDLSSQSLTGRIPAEIGGLTGLETLNLSDNSLTGSIPPGVGDLTSLTLLDLSGNRLSGGIPSQVGNLTALQTLDLSDNGLSGRVPQSLGEQDTSTPPQTKLGALTALRLNDNRLSGAIPAKLGNLTTLQELDLSNNSLSGAIPTELGGLTNLNGLVLGGNQLSGEIPSGVITMPGLERVDLSDNRLTAGTEGLPVPATTTTGLLVLNLSDNQLSGELPAGLSNWPRLEELRLADNRFSGDIPTGLNWGSFSGMSVLDLGDNNLTGAIPADLRGLNGLQKLFLDGNRFEEDISGWGSGLSGLNELFLAQTGQTLTGCIPGPLREVGKNDLPDLKLPYCDLFLSGLSFVGAILKDSTPFHRDTTRYQAVAGPSRVTITPGNDHSATFEYRDNRDNVLNDADPETAGTHEVDLASGTTTIKVVVVSQDTKAERVHEVRFERAGTPGRPTVDPTNGVTAGESRLTVAWTAPSSNGGWEIVSYDLRHIEHNSRDRASSQWTVSEEVWTTSRGGRCRQPSSNSLAGSSTTCRSGRSTGPGTAVGPAPFGGRRRQPFAGPAR